MAEKGRPYIMDGGGCHLLSPPWSLHPDLAVKAISMASYAESVLGVKLRIISGHRTCEEQLKLYLAGTGAKPGYSTHNALPALGFDVAYDFEPPTGTLHMLAAYAKCLGLRAGLYFVASDPNHFDMATEAGIQYNPCP